MITIKNKMKIIQLHINFTEKKGKKQKKLEPIDLEREIRFYFFGEVITWMYANTKPNYIRITSKRIESKFSASFFIFFFFK